MRQKLSIYFLLFSLLSLVADLVLAQSIESLERGYNKIRARQESDGGDPYADRQYPDYNWSENESNLEKIFRLSQGPKLPLFWLGEPGGDYRTTDIGQSRLVNHIESIRTLNLDSRLVNGTFSLRILIPHPESKSYAILKAIPEFRELYPTASEKTVVTATEIKGLKGHFFNGAFGRCHLVLELPASGLLDIFSKCELQPQLFAIVNALNLELLVKKLQS